MPGFCRAFFLLPIAMKNKTKKINGKAKQKLSVTEKQTEELPGYPLYPAGEDIMNKGKRLDVDLNEILENSQTIPANIPSSRISPEIETDKKESDLTKEDFQALGSDEIHSEGDDEILTNRLWPVDFVGADLDVPGSEQDDALEEIGSEDEENNIYSLGSENHTDLEEDRS